MKHPQIIRKEKKLEAIKELAKELTSFQIADVLNITPAYVRKLCKELNIKPVRVQLRPLTDIEHQVFIGSILGDGHITRHGKYKNSKLVIKHSIKQKQYVIYKYELLKRICPSKPVSKIQKETRESFHYKSFHNIIISTMCNPVLNTYRNAWYTKQGIKVLNKEAFNNITPLSIAIWFMDDGTKERSGLSIATMNFTFEEVSYMSKVLFEKYNIHTSIRKNKILYIKAKSCKDFINLIEPYIIDSMKYKIVRVKSSEFRETPEVDNPEPSK